MAQLEVVAAARTGLDFIGDAVAASTGGDTFQNSGRQLLIVANGSDSSMDLTIATSATIDGQAVADRTISIPAGESRIIGPFQPGIYNDTGGAVELTYSDETDVTVYVVAVP